MSCRIIETANEAVRNVPPGAGLGEPERMALMVAYVSERRAEVSSLAALARYGEAGPFGKLAKAERRHAAAVAMLLKAYGLKAPESMCISQEIADAELPDDPDAACGQRAGEEAKLVRIFEERLMPAVAGNPGLTAVFAELRDAARNRHLPALLRGAADTATGHRCGGGGQGRGHGHGHEAGRCCGGHAHGEGHEHACGQRHGEAHADAVPPQLHSHQNGRCCGGKGRGHGHCKGH